MNWKSNPEWSKRSVVLSFEEVCSILLLLKIILRTILSWIQFFFAADVLTSRPGFEIKNNILVSFQFVDYEQTWYLVVLDLLVRDTLFDISKYLVQT